MTRNHHGRAPLALASGSCGCRIDSRWVQSFLYVLIPFLFLRDRREKWDGGIKKWDQKVGPIVILIFKYIYFTVNPVKSLSGRAHKTLANGEGESWIDSHSAHFFHISASEKVGCAIVNHRIFLRTFHDYPVPSFTNNQSHFPFKTLFKTGRIYMGRNDDISCLILTIQAVPLPFKKWDYPALPTTDHMSGYL